MPGTDDPPAGGPTLELLVHGVGGTTPAEMLDDPRTVRVAGDGVAAVFRRADDVDAERAGRAGRTGAGATEDGAPVPPVQEAYVWCNLTSGNGSRALWLLLLPFMVVNLAHWMRPAARGDGLAVRLHGTLVRLAGLSLTVLLVAAACEVALDLTAWQCAGTPACVASHSWLAFLTDGWWSAPGRRLALAAVVPTALTVLLWYLSHRTWSAYESQQPLAGAERDEHGDDAPLGRPGFWYGRRLVARLRAAHTAAALLTVAAAVSADAARHDRAEGGPALLALSGGLLEAALAATALTVVWVVCRRGRSERRVDHALDARLRRALPLGSAALLLLAVVYACWSRPGWRSAGPLAGDAVFGAVFLAQGLLVVALAAVARTLHRSRPDARAALRGLAGPAVALLACALGGVMSGGVAQRVADWLDGRSGTLAGPPVVLTWQASVIPGLLAVVLSLLVVLAHRAWRSVRDEIPAVLRDHPGEPHDPVRVRGVARVRALAALTDRAPLLVGVAAAVTFLLGAGALAGALGTGRAPADAARNAPVAVAGLAEVAQAIGSWLIGLGFVLFVTFGRRAYRDASARRTIGILWDVGTFWPRAAHPFAPPCYAERAVPDLTWRMATWTASTGGRLVLSGHSQGSVLAAAAAWQLPAPVRARVALLTYGSPLERLYGRWFPAHFGPEALHRLHQEVDCWRNLHRRTDPIGGPVLVGDADTATPPGGPPCSSVDREPLKDPLSLGRTAAHPLPSPVLGHGDYQADPVFAEERAALLARLPKGLPAPRHGDDGQATAQPGSGRSSG
ncbi:hypothetical protein [Streptomyces chilikensis]|uniref:hypothetical protein n=1 Tax=Streptomyces chilikensis TaxID=1194079 RepID=UPI001409A801|nr:hypothetical protein [Streptomyces chilikensis]